MHGKAKKKKKQKITITKSAITKVPRGGIKDSCHPLESFLPPVLATCPLSMNLSWEQHFQAHFSTPHQATYAVQKS